MNRRFSNTAKLLNLALVPTAGGRKRPTAAWEKAAAEVAAAAGRPLGADQTFADEQGFLLSCMASDNDLLALGWTAAVTEAKTRLENRLRISRLVEEHPDIIKEEIHSPVFVLGLPRTATTLAHKILAASDAHRGPRMWEMLHTGIETDPALIEPIIQARAKQISIAPKIAPAWEVIHPVRVDMPEESIFLLPQGHYNLILRGEMPEYREWLDRRDTTPDYEYLKLALQVLQYGRDPKRWILKYPAHLNDMDVIHKVFPDAKFVWTHRDPVTAVGSLCSLMETSWMMYRKRVDLEAVGRVALQQMVRNTERGRASRANLPPGSIVDVPYALLNSDPHNGVPKIYEAIGAAWTEKDAGNLESVLARPVTDRKHEYGVERYGLDLGSIEDAFGDYVRVVANLNR